MKGEEVGSGPRPGVSSSFPVLTPLRTAQPRAGSSPAKRNLGGGSSADTEAGSTLYPRSANVSGIHALAFLQPALGLFCCLFHSHGIICKVRSTIPNLPQRSVQANLVF